MKSLIFTILLLALPVIAQAGFKQGDYELSIAASGTTPGNAGDFVMGGNVSLGYFVTDALELSVAQNVGYSDTTDNHWSGATSGEIDYHFPINDTFTLFLGGFVTASYADGVTASQGGGPDGGAKLFLSDNTILFAKVLWALPFQDNGQGGSVVDRSQVNYQVGISFRF